MPDGKPSELTDYVKEELAQEKSALEIEQLDFTNLAPRKPDWDLKRDIAPKLEKLERRTQKAIAELIRERLQGQSADLANVVAAGAGYAAVGGDDDED